MAKITTKEVIDSLYSTIEIQQFEINKLKKLNKEKIDKGLVFNVIREVLIDNPYTEMSITDLINVLTDSICDNFPTLDTKTAKQLQVLTDLVLDIEGNITGIEIRLDNLENYINEKHTQKTEFSQENEEAVDSE